MARQITSCPAIFFVNLRRKRQLKVQYLKNLRVEKIDCRCVIVKHLICNMAWSKEVMGSLPYFYWFLYTVSVSIHQLVYYSFVLLGNITGYSLFNFPCIVKTVLKKEQKRAFVSIHRALCLFDKNKVTTLLSSKNQNIPPMYSSPKNKDR